VCCKIVTEHKKMSSTLDKCPYCFNNIPKHLIIAIGMKVRIMLLYKIVFCLCYLALPLYSFAYRLFKDGHPKALSGF